MEKFRATHYIGSLNPTAILDAVEEEKASDEHNFSIFRILL